jgi:hypothetical protein
LEHPPLPVAAGQVSSIEDNPLSVLSIESWELDCEDCSDSMTDAAEAAWAVWVLFQVTIPDVVIPIINIKFKSISYTKSKFVYAVKEIS